MRNKRSEFEIPGLRAQDRADAEQSEADQEEGLAAKQAGQERARRQADGVGDQIGRHHPGRFVGADAHAAGDVGQHHVGDRGVEHLHEGRKRDQNGDDPRAGRHRAASRRSASCAAASLTRAPASARSRLSTSHRARRRVDAHGRDDRHARAERDVGRRIVQDELDRHALDDLDVVAGRVFGRQQREGRAGAGLDAVDMAVEVRVPDRRRSRCRPAAPAACGRAGSP